MSVCVGVFVYEGGMCVCRCVCSMCVRGMCVYVWVSV